MWKVALKAPRGTWLSGNKWKHFYISLLVPGTEVGPRLHSSNGIENAHDSQSSRENATPSHGTAPLAYYQEVASARNRRLCRLRLPLRRVLSIFTQN